MKYLLIILFSFLSLPFLMCACNDSTLTAANDATVYICTGPKARVYHKYSDCYGLSKCSGSIEKISETKAKKSRRRCRICY